MKYRDLSEKIYCRYLKSLPINRTPCKDSTANAASASDSNIIYAYCNVFPDLLQQTFALNIGLLSCETKNFCKIFASQQYGRSRTKTVNCGFIWNSSKPSCLKCCLYWDIFIIRRNRRKGMAAWTATTNLFFFFWFVLDFIISFVMHDENLFTHKFQIQKSYFYFIIFRH